MRPCIRQVVSFTLLFALAASSAEASGGDRPEETDEKTMAGIRTAADADATGIRTAPVADATGTPWVAPFRAARQAAIDRQQLLLIKAFEEPSTAAGDW